MLRLPTIDYNGGRRTYQEVSVVVESIIEERHWRNLWLSKTLKIMLKLESQIKFKDGDDEMHFSEHIIIHDFARDFSETKIGDVFVAKIGYANQNQQYYHCVNAFSVSILKQEGTMQLVQQ